MGKLLTILIRFALQLTARFTAAALGPLIRGGMIDKAAIVAVLRHVVSIYEQAEPIYEPAGPHTAYEIQEMSESLAGIFAVLRDRYGIAVLTSDLATLLEAVGQRIAAAPEDPGT